MILSDEQVSAIINVTRPLRAQEQAAFLAALAARLAGREEIGDGELGRTLAELQRQYFQPPTDAEISLTERNHRPAALPGERIRLGTLQKLMNSIR